MIPSTISHEVDKTSMGNNTVVTVTIMPSMEVKEAASKVECSDREGAIRIIKRIIRKARAINMSKTTRDTAMIMAADKQLGMTNTIRISSRELIIIFETRAKQL